MLNSKENVLRSELFDTARLRKVDFDLCVAGFIYFDITVKWRQSSNLKRHYKSLWIQSQHSSLGSWDSVQGNRRSWTYWQWSSLHIHFWFSRNCERVFLTNWKKKMSKPILGKKIMNLPSERHTFTAKVKFSLLIKKKKEKSCWLEWASRRADDSLSATLLIATLPAAGHSNYCCNRLLICVSGSFTGRLAFFTQPDRLKDL